MTSFYYNTDLPNLTTESYAQEFFMKYEEDTYDVFSSVFLRNLKEIPQQGEMKITDEECRFDNISFELFRSVDFWWILMEYNDKIDWDIKSGEKIKIPNIEALREFVHYLIVNANNQKI